MNRFKEAVRDIGVRRLYYEGYPTGINDLQRPLELATEFWHFVESKEWSLRANGHFEAATQVRKLQSFAYLTAVHIEKMFVLQQSGKKIDAYLSAFQSEYNRVYDQEFRQFEKKLKPSTKAILTPMPHQITPNQATVTVVDYFDKL